MAKAARRPRSGASAHAAIVAAACRKSFESLLIVCRRARRARSRDFDRALVGGIAGWESSVTSGSSSEAECRRASNPAPAPGSASPSGPASACCGPSATHPRSGNQRLRAHRIHDFPSLMLDLRPSQVRHPAPLIIFPVATEVAACRPLRRDRSTRGGRPRESRDARTRGRSTNHPIQRG